MNFFGKRETRNMIYCIPYRASLEAACSYCWMISAEDSWRDETFHAAAGLHRPHVSALRAPGSCPCAACACSRAPARPEVARSRAQRSPRGCPCSRPWRRGTEAARAPHPLEARPRVASSPKYHYHHQRNYRDHRYLANNLEARHPDT